MRLPSLVAVFVFLLMLGLAGSLDARGGRGGGGGGHASRGGGPKASGGQGGSFKHQAPSSHKPAGDKVTSHKPSKEIAAKDKPAKDKLTKDKAVKDKTVKDKTAKNKTASDSEGGDDDADEVGETANKKQQQLANFQRQRDHKISQAEHLRQIAERNGNANLAANADRMEAQALQQYADKVSHLEKFGVTDPDLDPTGNGLVDPGLVDPSLPSVAPNPLETLRGLFPLGR